MKKDFNEFRFEGLNCRDCSNKYLTMNRVSENGQKIVVKVSDSHLIETLYGYALILDKTRVVFLKKWQVSQNWFGNEVLLDKNYWQVKVWGNHEDFINTDENLSFESWLDIAKEQNGIDEYGAKLNPVKWEK